MPDLARRYASLFKAAQEGDRAARQLVVEKMMAVGKGDEETARMFIEADALLNGEQPFEPTDEDDYHNFEKEPTKREAQLLEVIRGLTAKIEQMQGGSPAALQEPANAQGL